MTLLVIVFCLLSERYLIHAGSYHRFRWFPVYAQWILARVSHWSSWIGLALVVVPGVLVTGLIIHFFSTMLFGFVEFLLNLMIFYYCLGPENPFYPSRNDDNTELTHEEIGDFFVKSNEQLFAIVFWYIFLGAMGIVAYRLIALCKSQPMLSRVATQLLDGFNYIPSRIAALLYLLSGDFHKGYREYQRLFFSKLSENDRLLEACGIAALGATMDKPFTVLQVEQLLERATIILLVFLSLLTIASWM